MAPIMKKFFLALTIFVLGLNLCLAAPQSQLLQTRFGNIKLPNASEISKAIDDLNSDSSLDDPQKQENKALYTKALNTLDSIKSIETKSAELKKILNNYKRNLLKLNQELNAEQKKQGLDPEALNKLGNDELAKRLDNLSGQLENLQMDMDTASAEHNYVQTLPEKSQSIITNNKTDAKKYLSMIDKTGDTDSIQNRILALLIYSGNIENAFYQTQLSNLSALQDLTNLKQKIANVKYKRTDSDVKLLNAALKIADSTDTTDPLKIDQEVVNSNPELLSISQTIEKFNGYIAEYKKKLIEYQEDYVRVDDANAKVEQIDKTLNTQIKELNKTLVLSRLLNKQLVLLPEVELKYDIDDTIANLNIYIYELRERADTLVDIQEYVDNEISKKPELATFKKELMILYHQRKQKFNELYQLLADGLSQTIDIKVKYNNYQKLYKKIRADIEEQLFWIKSNQPIGTEFFKVFIPSVVYETNSLITKLHTKALQTETIKTFTHVVIPFFLLGFVIFLNRKRIEKETNNLALRLDHASDSIYVTPLAILLNMVKAIPKMAWMIIVGTVVICLALGSPKYQIHVVLAMLLHIFVFVFFLQILKPNELAQRHFSVEPSKLKHYRNILIYVWTCALPLLIFANVAEADSQKIYADLTSFLVVLFSCLGLLLLSLILLLTNLKDLRYTSASYIFTCIVAMGILAIAVVSVGSGYLYTVVKLTNRIAYSCYIVIAYYLINQTTHRMIYVASTKLFEKKKLLEESNEEKKDVLSSLLSVLNMSASRLCEKIFKFTNFGLIALTAVLLYLQWSDLASVLRYLDTIHLWSKTEYVNGQAVIIDYLSVANVLFAALIILITSVLNKNLPVIFEKLLLIKKDERLKSTSYSVKVISSYIIIALGTIFTAGSIGIKWENLQWLVAALSVGLGFGLQAIFANFVSGIILLFERQLRVGDIITLNGQSGTVKRIRIRSTTVMSFDNKEVMIPNREFITSALTNWSLTSTVTKIEFNVGIAYGADVNKAKNILRNIVNKCRYISKDHSSLIYVSSLDASSVNICCEVYVGVIGERKLTIDYLSSETLSAYAKAGIEIPFSQLDLNVKTLEKTEFLENMRKSLFNSNLAKEELENENNIKA